MTLEDFENMKNGYGLVPMVMNRAYTPYGKDTTAGFTPKDALALYQSGTARLPGEAAPQVPGQQKVSGAITSQTAKPQVAKAKPSGPEIPEDWETRGPIYKVALAKQINPHIAASDVQTIEQIAEETIRGAIAQNAS